MFRIEQLTFTRFIAALSIVIYHYGNDSILFNNKYLSFIFNQANVGVSYFYVLSGFVMIIAYSKVQEINPYEYLKNRMARVYPLYVLAILLILTANLFATINGFDLILNLLMIQSWFPGKALTINIPGWSISVEFFFYCVFPLLFNFFYKRYNFKVIFISGALFWILSQIVYHLFYWEILKYSNFRDVMYFPILHLNTFIIGNLAGLYFIDHFHTKQASYSKHILILILILIGILKFPIGLDYHNGFLAIIFAFLILLISLNKDKMKDFFSNKVFVFLGEISYGIYILQVPIWIIFSDYRMDKYLGLNKVTDFTTSFLIRLTLLFLISAIGYLCIEKPLRKVIRKTGFSRLLARN